MRTINFEFNGPRTIVTNDEHLSKLCAEDIIQGKSYPLPTWEYEPKVVVDLGGHAGEFSVMARLRWPDAEVHCYEPNPELGEYLATNALTYHFHVHPVAVTPLSGMGRIPLHKSGYGSVANSIVDRPNQTSQTYSVPTIGIPEVLELLPDVLKMDVEGIEWQLFQAITANDPLSIEKITMIYLEFHAAGDRWLIENLLHHTHDVWHARIGHAEQGEMLYIKKHTVPKK